MAITVLLATSIHNVKFSRIDIMVTRYPTILLVEPSIARSGSMEVSLSKNDILLNHPNSCWWRLHPNNCQPTTLLIACEGSSNIYEQSIERLHKLLHWLHLDKPYQHTTTNNRQYVVKARRQPKQTHHSFHYIVQEQNHKPLLLDPLLTG